MKDDTQKDTTDASEQPKPNTTNPAPAEPQGDEGPGGGEVNSPGKTP